MYGLSFRMFEDNYSTQSKWFCPDCRKEKQVLKEMVKKKHALWLIPTIFIILYLPIWIVIFIATLIQNDNDSVMCGIANYN